MGGQTGDINHNHDVKVSTNILIDYLRDADYDIPIPFTTASPCIRKIIPFDHTVDEVASTLLLMDTASYVPANGGGPSPCILFLKQNEEISDDNVRAFLNARPKACVVRATSQKQTIRTLVSDIQGCFLSVSEYAYKSALALSSPTPLQSLVDVAEKEFGLFISIVDSSYTLLAYTHNIKPLDEVNESLIKKGYHTDEILSSQRHNTYLSEEIGSQTGIKSYPASNVIPCALLTTPLFIQQRYAGLVVMSTKDEQFTPGQENLFEMFAGFCTMALKKTLGISAVQGDLDQEFLLHLINGRITDTPRIKRQMTLLNIPTDGFFMMALFQVPPSMLSQVGFILDEIRACKSIYALPVVSEGSIAVLFNGESPAIISRGIQQLITGRVGDYIEGSFESLFFTECPAIPVAYQSLLVGNDFVKVISGAFQEKKRISFAEIFAFIIMDPKGNPAVKSFAASHTVIEEVLKSDAEKGSNDFELLTAYLSNGKKVAQIAALFHLHRNGVTYRIDRIQNHYNIDLSDPTTRNYVQSAIFCKIATNPECAQRVVGLIS